MRKLVSDKLVGYLRERIGSGKIRAGEKLPGENALAESFGIARASVRKGIKQLVGEGLLISRQGKGVFVTVPSDLLKTRCFKVGLVTRSVASEHRELLEAQSALCEILSAAGCAVELLPVPDLSKNLSGPAMDYYVWLFANDDLFPLIGEFAVKTQKPFLMFARYLPGMPEAPGALAAQDFAVGQAVTLLLNYGHKKILYLHRGERQYNQVRIALYKEALERAGINAGAGDIVNIDYIGGAKGAAELVMRLKPDALFFGQGVVCRDTLFILYGKGARVPEDFSVITFDKVDSPYDCELTHIHCDIKRLAAITAEYILLNLKRVAPPPPPPVLRADLIMGDSCLPRR